jgi:protein-L-isoaspartate(D-aspartate) O-methyltransferase
MKDTYRHQGLRKNLVAEIKRKGITDQAVLKAIETVPRHFFFDNAFIEFAYQDNAFPIGAGQTISKPYTVAFQTGLLQVEKGDRILEIGTGSGYQTCILLELGARVFSVERQKLLYDKTRVLLPQLGYNPRLFYGDGYKGLPAFAPFDKILVTCGAPEIPDELIKQLKVGGIMVVPTGSGEVQIMKTLVKVSENQHEITDFGAFRFVPMLGEKAR